MTGSVEAGKDTAKDVASRAAIAKPAAKRAPAEPKASPSAQLKQALAEPPATPARKPALSARTLRYAAVAAVSLVVGTAFGMVTAPKPASVEALGGIQASLEARRGEAARLDGEIEKLGGSLALLRESADSARNEYRALGASVEERLKGLEQSLGKKIAGLSETVEKTGHEQGAKLAALAAQAEKRAAAPVSAPVATPTVTPSAAILPAARTEPTQTGTIAETKPKTDAIEGWAVRDVYQGVAMLEDRKRRLVEVGPGDLVPGVGRVEAVQRRGRTWVVVTKQGIITPQTW